MTVRNFDDWRLIILQNVTIRHKVVDSEIARRDTMLEKRQYAADYMRELARRHPDNFEYKVERCRASLRHKGGTP